MTPDDLLERCVRLEQELEAVRLDARRELDTAWEDRRIAVIARARLESELAVARELAKQARDAELAALDALAAVVAIVERSGWMSAPDQEALRDARDVLAAACGGKR